jgi:hypothetical protein
MIIRDNKAIITDHAASLQIRTGTTSPGSAALHRATPPQVRSRRLWGQHGGRCIAPIAGHVVTVTDGTVALLIGVPRRGGYPSPIRCGPNLSAGTGIDRCAVAGHGSSLRESAESECEEAIRVTKKTVDSGGDRDNVDRPAHQVRLPGFIIDEDIGLGDVIKQATSYIGVAPCGGCERRASVLNRWMTFTNRGPR